jgi:hypothetical protein
MGWRGQLPCKQLVPTAIHLPAGAATAAATSTYMVLSTTNYTANSCFQESNFGRDLSIAVLHVAEGKVVDDFGFNMLNSHPIQSLWNGASWIRHAYHVVQPCGTVVHYCAAGHGLASGYLRTRIAGLRKVRLQLPTLAISCGELLSFEHGGAQSSELTSSRCLRG